MQNVPDWVGAAAQRLAVDLAASVLPAAPPDGVWRVVLVARSAHGQVVTYAPALEVSEAGSLIEVTVTPDDTSPMLQRLAIEAARDLVGAGAVRFPPDEVAPGHLTPGVPTSAAWTLDACVTSLFENHVRGVLDLPLGSPALHATCVAMCSVGAASGMHGALRHCMARDPFVRIHLYGSQAPVGTTIGHTCVVGDDAEDVHRRARHAADYLTGTIEE